MGRIGSLHHRRLRAQARGRNCRVDRGRRLGTRRFRPVYYKLRSVFKTANYWRETKGGESGAGSRIWLPIGNRRSGIARTRSNSPPRAGFFLPVGYAIVIGPRWAATLWESDYETIRYAGVKPQIEKDRRERPRSRYAGLSLYPDPVLCPGSKAAGCMAELSRGAGARAVYQCREMPAKTRPNFSTRSRVL